jgi:hypothetical protein
MNVSKNDMLIVQHVLSLSRMGAWLGGGAVTIPVPPAGSLRRAATSTTKLKGNRNKEGLNLVPGWCIVRPKCYTGVAVALLILNMPQQ